MRVRSTSRRAYEEYIKFMQFSIFYPNRLIGETYCFAYRHLFRQRSIFPGSHPPSIIDVKELNFRVRNGNGWILLAIVTGSRGCTLKTKQCINDSLLSLNQFWSSPRPISTGQLNILLHLHLRPINHVVFVGPYYLMVWEILS